MTSLKFFKLLLISYFFIACAKPGQNYIFNVLVSFFYLFRYRNIIYVKLGSSVFHFNLKQPVIVSPTQKKTTVNMYLTNLIPK